MGSDESRSESALACAVTAGAHAASFGFDWLRAVDALGKVTEESGELAEAITSGRRDDIVEELGDLLFAACNVARLLTVDPDEALREATQKFERRFNLVLEECSTRGEDPRDLSLDELEAIWLLVK